MPLPNVTLGEIETLSNSNIWRQLCADIEVTCRRLWKSYPEAQTMDQKCMIDGQLFAYSEVVTKLDKMKNALLKQQAAESPATADTGNEVAAE